MDLSPWVTKTVRLHWADRTFAFDVSQALFSSNAVDQGSLLLLKSLSWDALAGTRHIVDFGCGYGPLGIVAAATMPDARLTMIDRDKLATAFAWENAVRNLPERAGRHSMGATVGLDLHNLSLAGPGRCDLLLWNVPGKAGEPVLRGLCGQIPEALEPGGLAALVVVNPLAEAILDAIAALPYIDAILTERHTAHTVIHLRRDESAVIHRTSRDAFASGVFDREERIVELGELAYAFKPVYGLPEYENPDFSSAVAIEMLAAIGPAERCLIYQPGQGHIALATLLLNGTREWTLGGRDQLSLRATKRNLVINGADPDRITLAGGPELHVMPWDGPAEMAIATLEDQLSPARIAKLVADLAEATAPGGNALLAGRSTSVTRVVAAMTKGGRFRAGKRLKRHGASAAIMRRLQPSAFDVP